MKLTEEEAARLLSLSDVLRDVLESWKGHVTRGEALSACLVLAGAEGGYENAHGSRDAFLAHVTQLVGWAYDLAATSYRESAS